MAHILIDFETLGSALNGKVTYVSWCHFDIKQQETIDEILPRVKDFKFNWLEQEQYELDDGVIEFWKKQPMDIRQEMLGNPEDGRSIKEFLNEFSDTFFSTGFSAKTDVLWSRGNTFDITILDRLYSDEGIDTPYPFWRVRDARTFIDAVNVLLGRVNKDGTPFMGKLGTEAKVSNHSASFDVAKDISQLQETYSILVKDLENSYHIN